MRRIFIQNRAIKFFCTLKFQDNKLFYYICARIILANEFANLPKKNFNTKQGQTSSDSC